MHKRVLIITGMHRSGTSVLSQWLHRQGLPIGEHLLNARVGNVQGHFEDEDFLHLHEQLLSARKLPPDGLTHHPLAPLSPAEKGQMEALLLRKSAQHEQWGWKEPRTCLFLEDYHTLLPGAKYLVVTRNYISTVSSLLSRDYRFQQKKIEARRGLSKLKWKWLKAKSLEQILEQRAEPYLRTWIRYNREIVQHLNTLPPERFHVVSQAQLAAKDRQVFERLTGPWQFSLEYLPFKNVYEPTLLNKALDLEPYIRQKTLLQEATALEMALNDFCS